MFNNFLKVEIRFRHDFKSDATSNRNQKIWKSCFICTSKLTELHELSKQMNRQRMIFHLYTLLKRHILEYDPRKCHMRATNEKYAKTPNKPEHWTRLVKYSHSRYLIHFI
jgi:hypothetical protein